MCRRVYDIKVKRKIKTEATRERARPEGEILE